MKNLKERQEIYEKALNVFGEKNQFEMLQEEATELALAARRFIRLDNDIYLQEVAKEIGDLKNMIEQIEMMFPGIENQIETQRQNAIYKLEDLLKKRI